MKDFVVSSALTRLLANIFIFVCLLVALFVCAYQVLNSQQISPICYIIVSTGMSYSLMLLGMHTGIATIPVEEVKEVKLQTAENGKSLSMGDERDLKG